MLYASSFIPLFFFFTLIVELLVYFLFHGLRREELWAQCNWQQSVEFPGAFSDTNPEQVWRTQFYILWNMISLILQIKLHLIPVRFLPNIIIGSIKKGWDGR